MRKKGLTLVEILISTLVLAILTGGIITILNIGTLAWNYDMGLVDLQQYGRQSIDSMIKEIRQTKASVLSVPISTRVNFQVPTDISTIPPTYSSTISYYLSNNSLIREYPTGTSKVIANDVNTVTFCCLGGANCSDCANADLLRINITFSKVSRSRPLSFSLIEQVRLRND